MSFLLSCLCVSDAHSPQSKNKSKEVIETAPKIPELSTESTCDLQKAPPRSLSYAFTELSDTSPDITEGSWHPHIFMIPTYHDMSFYLILTHLSQ
jgi:hypothetical protein